MRAEIWAVSSGVGSILRAPRPHRRSAATLFGRATSAPKSRRHWRPIRPDCHKRNQNGRIVDWTIWDCPTAVHSRRVRCQNFKIPELPANPVASDQDRAAGRCDRVGWQLRDFEFLQRTRRECTAVGQSNSPVDNSAVLIPLCSLA